MLNLCTTETPSGIQMCGNRWQAVVVQRQLNAIKSESATLKMVVNADRWLKASCSGKFGCTLFTFLSVLLNNLHDRRDGIFREWQVPGKHPPYSRSRHCSASRTRATRDCVIAAIGFMLRGIPRPRGLREAAASIPPGGTWSLSRLTFLTQLPVAKICGSAEMKVWKSLTLILLLTTISRHLGESLLDRYVFQIEVCEEWQLSDLTMLIMLNW
jgi:hypothetical protein